MGPLLQNDHRAYRTLSILALLLFITLTNLFFNYVELQMLSGMKSRNNIPDLLIAFRQGVMGNLQLGFVIVGLVFFVKWFKTAYQNLHLIDERALQFKPKWAIGCWFMPVYNLYHPYQIMKEIWGKTQVFNHSPQTEQTSLIKVWWTLMVVNGVARVISWRVSFQADSIAEMVNACQLNIFCDITLLLGIFATFSLIHKVLGFEKELWASRNSLVGFY